MTNFGDYGWKKKSRLWLAVAPAILTSSDRFAPSSSIKEEEGDRRGRSDQTPSSSLMEEVAPKATEMVTASLGRRFPKASS